jgi:hypothetical protein
MTGFITVDLDSTLFDTRHRAHLIDRVNGTDWVAYSMACVDDEPIVATVALIDAMSCLGVDVVYVTGRDEASRDVTLKSLTKHNLPVHGLFMDNESNGATYNHADYKLRRVQGVLSDPEWKFQKHFFHVDDWPDVKVKLEEAGIPCLCVRAPHEIDAFMQELKEGPM